MSFQKTATTLRDRLLKDSVLKAALRNGALMRIGQATRLDLQGCNDLTAVTLSLIPVSEDESNADLGFEPDPQPEDGGDEVSGRARIRVKYTVMLRFMFEKAVEDRLLDRGDVPGLFTLVRTTKNAIMKEYSLGLEEGGQDYETISVNYIRTAATGKPPEVVSPGAVGSAIPRSGLPPMVQADMTVRFSEVVEIGFRGPE